HDRIEIGCDRSPLASGDCCPGLAGGGMAGCQEFPGIFAPARLRARPESGSTSRQLHGAPLWRGSAPRYLPGAVCLAGEQRIDLAGDVALEAAHDLGLGLALGGAPGDVVPGLLMTAHADQGDAPQGAV